jgi:hypothetical protein
MVSLLWLQTSYKAKEFEEQSIAEGDGKETKYLKRKSCARAHTTSKVTLNPPTKSRG